MSVFPGDAGAIAVQQAAIAQAIKASGSIVKLEPAEFERIIARQEGLLVVTARGGWFSRNYQYLTSYKGLAFYCGSDTPLHLPGDVETITARTIWIPS
jgi:hypothetical protein